MMTMARRPSRCRIAALAAAAMLIAPAGHAFTIDDGDGKNKVPRFDLEEQARNFRAPKADLATPGTQRVETPFGMLHFGVQSRTSVFDLGADAAARNRRHYERMFAPDFMKDRY
jgi:hypothetical protein